jgi:DNA-binding MarR family transcriptional regulator
VSFGERESNNHTGDFCMPLDLRLERRTDAIFMEARVLLSIHNALKAYNAHSWEVSQLDLAEFLQIGERSVQRITKRLVELGKLVRKAGNGRSVYIYSIPPNAIGDTLLELLLRYGVYIVETPEGFCYLEKAEEFLARFSLDTYIEK